MKKMLAMASVLATTSLFAAGPQFENLSQSNVDDLTREFSGNFAHTGVSAPETSGLWGVEIGVIGGQSASPDLKDVVEDSGGDGSKFKNLYHAGAMARAHFPFDLFAELTVLPEQEISDAKIKNMSYEVGWNAGGFFGLPLDLAVGLNFSNSEMSFTQDPTTNVTTESKIKLTSSTRVLWVGVSKTFLFFTPYFKVGSASSDSTLKASTSVFANPAKTKMDSTNSGAYMALGANLQFAFFKFGVEGTQVMDVKKATAKISFDF